MVARAVGSANGEYLAEFEIRCCERVLRAKVRAVFHTRQADRKITAVHRLSDGRPRDLYEAGLTMQAVGNHLRDLDVEAAHNGGIRGIRFNKGSAPFCVAAPAKLASGRRRRAVRT